MFGNPLGPLAMSTKRSPQDMKLIEETLMYIAANLQNIRKVFGVKSEQYESAASILDQFKEQMRQKKFNEGEIDELMQKMSLDDSSNKSEGAKSA
jgi:urease gamma subunit